MAETEQEKAERLAREAAKKAIEADRVREEIRMRRAFDNDAHGQQGC